MPFEIGKNNLKKIWTFQKDIILLSIIKNN